MKYILDTGAAVAFATPTDQYHLQSRAVFREPRVSFVTTSIVLGEMYTFIQRRRGFAPALRWVRAASQSGLVDVIHLDEAQERAIWQTLERLAGIPLSYADASLVLLAQLTGIDTIFTFDEDFRDAGLKVVPGL